MSELLPILQRGKLRHTFLAWAQDYCLNQGATEPPWVALPSLGKINQAQGAPGSWLTLWDSTRGAATGRNSAHPSSSSSSSSPSTSL